jgi:hypothetical protein
MSRSVLFAIALLGLFIVAGASGAAAQTTVRPVPIDVVVCDSANGVFDLDGDGVVGKSDWYHWRNAMVSLGCPIGSPAAGSCSRLDLNGDGTIDLDDQQAFIDHFTLCAKRQLRRANEVAPRNPTNPIDPRP